MDGKYRRYVMLPAYGMVVLPKNPSTGNGQIPGWSCILSVGSVIFKLSLRFKISVALMRADDAGRVLPLRWQDKLTLDVSASQPEHHSAGVQLMTTRL